MKLAVFAGLLLGFIGQAPCARAGEATVTPTRPTLALRRVDFDSLRPTLADSAQRVLDDLNELINEFRTTMNGARPSDAEANFELRQLKLRLIQSNYRLSFAMVAEGASPRTDMVQRKMDEDTATALFSDLLDKSLFDPFTGLYKALPVVAPLAFDQNDSRFVVASVRLPVGWSGYEPTLAVFSLSEQRGTPPAVCERISRMKFDRVIQDPAAGNGRVAILRFHLDTPGDQSAVLALRDKPDLVIVAHYFESPASTSNAAYTAPSGNSSGC